MPNIINAQSTPFAALVQSCDGSGDLQFQSANTAVLTINTYGAIGVGSSANYGTAGQYIQSAGNGAPATWATPSTSPGGSDTYVQFNNSGTFGGDSGFVYRSGNVGIGISTPNQNSTGVTCHINSSTAGTWATTHYTNGNTGSAADDGFLVGTLGTDGAYVFNYENTPMIFATNGAERVRISAAGGFSVGTIADPGAGAIYATGNITAYYSDDRLKTKLGGIKNALDKVKSLSGFYYEANQTAQDLGYQAVREVGVSAQQVQAVLPEVVKPAPIDQQYLTVDYERLVPLLIEAIKELEEKVAKLEAK